MDELTRYHYLKALGIPLWYKKDQLMEPSSSEKETRDLSQIVEQTKPQKAQELKVEYTHKTVESQDFTIEEKDSPFLSYWIANKTIKDIQAQREILETSQYEETLKAFYKEKGEEFQTLKFLYGHLPKAAEILVITDPPLANEFLAGKLFSEKVRPLFYALFSSIGFAQETIAFTSFIKTDSPWMKSRPHIFTHELTLHLEFLMAEIELVRPKAFIFMGREVAKTLLFPQKPFKQMQEELEVIKIGAESYPLILLPRPELIFQNIRLKRECWQQLKKLKRALQ